jgi:nicotinamidase-related amidase
VTGASALAGLTGGGALLVVDVQRSFGDPAYLADYGLDDAESDALVAAIAATGRLVDVARDSGVPVFWIELASDPATPWGSSNWLRGGDPSVMAADEPCIVGTPGADWYGVSPAAGEPRILKKHYSGFHQTSLDELLQSSGVEWVVVAGLTTECCIAATATDAMQNGYPVLIPTDATAAYEVRIHENALEQLALSVARLTTVADLEAALADGTSASTERESSHA